MYLQLLMQSLLYLHLQLQCFSYLHSPATKKKVPLVNCHNIFTIKEDTSINKNDGDYKIEIYYYKEIPEKGKKDIK